MPKNPQEWATRPWEERLDLMATAMREISNQYDPVRMQAQFTARMLEFLPVDCLIHLSRT